MAKHSFDYLEKLRQRPEPVRRWALLALSSGLTLLIFFLWLLNLKYVGPLARLSQPAVESTVQSARTGVADALVRIKAGWRVFRQRLAN
ncbi:MAG: hypothetical protein HYT46_01890 [Candidatus Vogelbacteria bacterium]|nr:hypothetical protein [Candidatus Vogelbacteria bacterium]